MNITKLAAKPQLTAVILNDPQIVQKYGEEIEFWTWDRQPLAVFMKLTAVATDNSAVVDVAKDLILDEGGTPVLRDGVMIPTDILIAAIGRITEILGK